jgi:hypothetical protein
MDSETQEDPMTDYREVVTGRIVDENGNPLADIEVSAYDKDPLVDDTLGSCTTDSSGRFQVEFNWSDFKGGEALEGRPDLYLEYADPRSGKKGRSDVWEESRGDVTDDDSAEIIDLGDIVVGP